MFEIGLPVSQYGPPQKSQFQPFQFRNKFFSYRELIINTIPTLFSPVKNYKTNLGVYPSSKLTIYRNITIPKHQTTRK